MAEVPLTEIEIRLRGIPGETEKSPAVDLIASATRKYRHKPFGEMMKKLASTVKTALKLIGEDTSNWNRKWALAAKVFSELWSGHAPSEIRDVMVDYGVKALKLDRKVAEVIVDAVIVEFSSIARERGVWASRMYRGAAVAAGGAPAPARPPARPGAGGLGTQTA